MRGKESTKQNWIKVLPYYLIMTDCRPQNASTSYFGIFDVTLLLFLMLFSSVESVKCVKSPYKYLALEGGGVKGIVYGGSAAALETAGMLSNIVGFSGSSAGSQGAALLAAGFTGEELTKEVNVAPP